MKRAAAEVMGQITGLTVTVARDKSGDFEFQSGSLGWCDMDEKAYELGFNGADGWLDAFQTKDAAKNAAAAAPHHVART